MSLVPVRYLPTSNRPASDVWFWVFASSRSSGCSGSSATALPRCVSRPVRAGDVPTAPAPIERRAVIDRIDERARVRGHALRVGDHRRHDHRGRALVAGPVAEQAFHAAPLKHGALDALRVERVEREAAARFDGHHLVDTAAWHHADRHGIVEVDRPGVLRIDQRVLKTGLREHEHLRIDADTELREQAGQIARSLDVIERRGAAREPAAEPSEGVARRGLGSLRPQRNDRTHKQEP